MRRKSARTAKKSPEKVVKTAEPPKTRRSRRRKRSPSKSSESEEEVITKTKRAPLEETPDTTTKSYSPSDEETSQERMWKVETSSEETPKGEIQKLKICLARPSPDSPDKSKTRRSKSSSHTEDDATSSEDKTVTRRTRSAKREEPDNKTEDEDVEEKKGKGKSKGKHKSKIEKTPLLTELNELKTNNEISENAQVTPQSPSTIDIPVDNENHIDKVDDPNDTQNFNQEEHNNEQQNTEFSQIMPEHEIVVVPIQDISEPKQPEPEIPAHNSPEIAHTREIPEITKVHEEIPNSNEISEQAKTEISKETETIPQENCKEPQEQCKVQAIIIEPDEKSESSNECKIKEMQENSNENNKMDDSNEDSNESVQEKPNNVVVNEENPENMNVEVDEKIQETQFEIIGQVQTNVNDDKMEVDDQQIGNDEQSVETAIDEEEPVQNDESSKRKLLRRTIKIASENRCLDRSTDRKEGWKKSSKNLTSSLIKVDLNTIQIICPNIEFPQEVDLNFDLDTNKERRRLSNDHHKERKVSIDNENAEKPTFETQISIGSSQDETEDNSNIIAFNRKISIVEDTASKLKPPPSPAKNPISEILFITNLVRPFTIKQLKELLERTGHVKDDGFWTDKIKSKCYVSYEAKEEAEATRNALHGVQWPIGNGKNLIIEYATLEDLENARKPPPAPTPAPQPTLPTQEELKTAEKENDMEKSNKNGERGKEVDKRKIDGPVREWDIGKKDMRERSRSRDRNRKHRRSPSPNEDFVKRKQRKIEEEEEEETAPQKLMDDLFLKTKTTPSIYWQPLTPEEIQTKQKQRLMRMEEHKRRIEENTRFNKERRDFGRGAPFRRRYN